MKLVVDDRVIDAAEGMTVLEACLANGIYIPNLCFVEGMEEPPASCRLCFVEVQGMNRPVPSCTVKVREGMALRTDTTVVRRLQRSALQLLLSAHEVDCGACPANRRCELQRMAKFLKVGLKPKRLERLLKPEGEERHPFLRYLPNRCVLCGRCVYVCQKTHGRPPLTFAKRGFDTVISLYGECDPSGPHCTADLACVEVCPVAALERKTLAPDTP